MPAKDMQQRLPNQVLAGLQELVADMIAEPDLQVVLQKAAQRTAQLVGADMATVHLYDPATGRVRAAAAYGLRDAERFHLHGPDRGKVALLVADRRGPVIAETVHTSELAGPFAAREGVQSAAGFPLQVGDQVIGVLFVSYREPHKFEPEEVETLISFGNLAAIAINTANSYEQAKQRASTIHHISEVGQSLLAIQDLETLLRKIAQVACSVLKADVVVLYEYDEEMDDVRIPPVFCGEISHPQVLEDRNLARLHRESAVFKVLERANPFYASDARKDWTTLTAEVPPKEQKQGGFIQREGIASSAAVRLTADGERIGVLFVNYRTPHIFQDEEKETIELFATQAAIAIRNARFLQEQQTLRQQAEMLGEFSVAISRSLDLRQVASTILDELRKVVDYRKASMELIQGDSRNLVAHRGYPDKDIDPWLLRSIKEDRLVTRIVMAQKPLLLADPPSDPDWEVLPTTQDIESWIGLPLVYDKEVIGLVTLDHDKAQYYAESVVGLLATYANQAAVALKNALLYDEAQRHIRALNIIGEVTRIINTKLDPDNLLQTISIQVADKLRCTHCTLFFAEQRDGETILVPKVTNGTRPQVLQRLFRLDEGLVGWVFQHGESVVLADARQDDRFAPAREGREQPRSMLVAPIKVSGRTIGVISADQDAYGWFKEDDRLLAEELALQAGIAIERSIGLGLLQEIGGRILSAGKMSEVLHHVVAGARRLTNTTSGVIYEISGDGKSVTESHQEPHDFNHPWPRLDKEEGLTRRIVATGEVLAFADISQDSRVNDELLRRGIRSMIAVPLKREDRVVGVLYLNDEKPHEFSETEKSLLLSLANYATLAMEKARLLEDAERRIRDLQIVNDVAQIMGSKLETEALLDTIATQIAEKLRCTHCTLFFARELGDMTWLVPEVTSGNRPQILERRFAVGEGLVGWAFDTGKPVVLADARQDPHFAAARNERGVPRSMLLVPIKMGDRTVGVISADQDEYGWFSDNDALLVEGLARQAGTAIERAAGLDLLREVSEQIISASQVHVGGTLQQVVSGALKLTHATSGVIFLLSEDGRNVLAQYEHPQGFNHPCPRLEEGKEGVTREILRSGKVIHIPDTKNEPSVHPDMRKRARSMIGVPLKLEHKVIGVLFLFDREPHHFTETQMMLLQTLAGQAAIAIRNSDLFAIQERQVKGHRALNALAAELMGERDERRILECVVQSAAKTLECMHCSIFRREDDRVVVRASKGNRGASLQDGRWFKLGQGVAGWVAEQGEPALVRETGGYSHFESNWSSPQPDPRSLVVVPIHLEGKIYGVISTEHDEPNAFDQHDQMLLESLAALVGQAVQNARQFDTRQRLETQLESLYEVVQEQRLESVLDRIVKSIREIFGERITPTINLYNQANDKFSRTAAGGPLSRDLQASPRPGGTGRFVIDTKSPLYIDDVSNPPAGCPTIREEYKRLGIQSFAAIPLRRRDQTVGVLYVNSQERLTFSPEIKRVLQLFAGQAAIAIHIRQDLERKISELEVLTEIGRTVSNLDISQILDLVYSQMARILDLKDAQVQFAFYDQDKDEVAFPLAVEQDKERGGVIDLVRWGKRESQYREIDEDKIVEQLKSRQRRDPPGLTEYVIRTQQPILIGEDFEKRATELGIRVWPTFGRFERSTHSWMGVPMIVQGRVIGIISIQSLEQEHAFDSGHMQLLTTLANQAAVAIENAGLYKTKKHAVEQLHLIRENALEMSKQLDLVDVLRATAAAANEVLGADFTTVFAYDPERGFEQGVRAGKFDDTPALPDIDGWEAEIVRERKPRKVERIEEESQVAREFLDRTGVLSYVGYPIYFADHPVGLMFLNFLEPCTFTEAETEWIQILASQAAVAIENARSVARVEEVERLEATSLVAADVLHRVGNYLGSIQTRLQLVKKEFLVPSEQCEPSKVAHELDDILGGIQETRSQVHRTLERPPEEKPQYVNLDILLQSALIRVETRVRDRVTFTADIESDVPPVLCHSTQLFEAVHAILDNAVNAVLEGGGGGTVSVSFRREASEGKKPYAKITVSDTGIGIPEEEMPKLFELWYTTKRGGIGYGLWRARSVVRQLGGDIAIKSKQGEGTQVEIAIPLGR